MYYFCPSFFHPRFLYDTLSQHRMLGIGIKSQLYTRKRRVGTCGEIGMFSQPRGLFAGIFSFILCFWCYHWVPAVAGAPPVMFHACPQPPKTWASFPRRPPRPLLVCLCTGLGERITWQNAGYAWTWVASNFSPSGGASPPHWDLPGPYK